MSTVNPSATVTIASGQTVSNAIDLGEMAVVGLITPSAITSTAVTFQASADNVTYNQVTKVDATVYSVTVSASKHIVIPPADLAGIRWLKVVAGSAEGGDRTIYLTVRAV